MKIYESGEDYLEMICRQNRQQGFARIGALAQVLHVKPSSASKMARRLQETGYVVFHKYGEIKLTDKGQEYGDFLLRRHEMLRLFFHCLNGSDDELRQTEQVEHFITKETLENLEKLMKREGWLKGP